MDKATEAHCEAFEAILGTDEYTFKVSGSGRLNITGGDRSAVEAAATRVGAFIVHDGKVLGRDAKGYDSTGYDAEGYDRKGRNVLGEKRPAKTPATLEVLRDDAGVRIEKAGRRLQITLPYGHPAKGQIKALGAHWDAAGKFWWIGSAKQADIIEAIEAGTTAQAQQEEERRLAAERKQMEAAAAASERRQAEASRVNLAIPYAAAEVREFAKTNGARWRPEGKFWSLPVETADAIKAKLREWEALSPVRLHKFSQNSAVWAAGQVIWATETIAAGVPDGGAYVVVTSTERSWNRGGDGVGYPEDGYVHTGRGRLATDEEAARVREEREAAAALRRARVAYEQAEASAEVPAAVAPAAEGSMTYVKTAANDGFEQAATIEPEGTDGRRIIFTTYRGGDGDLWIDGNFGIQNTVARPVPYTTELEAAITAIAQTTRQA